jgi:hypothetical protein
MGSSIIFFTFSLFEFSVLSMQITLRLPGQIMTKWPHMVPLPLPNGTKIVGAWRSYIRKLYSAIWAEIKLQSATPGNVKSNHVHCPIIVKLKAGKASRWEIFQKAFKIIYVRWWGFFICSSLYL